MSKCCQCNKCQIHANSDVQWKLNFWIQIQFLHFKYAWNLPSLSLAWFFLIQNELRTMCPWASYEYFLYMALSQCLKRSLLAKKFLNFINGFNSAILSIFPFCQIALLNPCIKFNFFGQKTSFEALWKCHIQKIFITCSRICQIQYLGQSKCNLRLLKKDSQDFKNYFNLGFL